jgi:2Fe-2S ferredoxin
MTQIIFISPTGQQSIVQAPAGQSAMLAALQGNVRGIEADCGGSLSCATCHVYVADHHAALLPPPSADELSMLDFVAAERRPSSRLSCQIVATADLETLELRLPECQTA